METGDKPRHHRPPAMISPLQLRNLAAETGTTVFRSPLTVTPEGRFVIANRFAPLNEAIIALGAFYRKAA